MATVSTSALLRINRKLDDDDLAECWRCLSTSGPLVELDGIRWRRRGEAELRPALVCASCATRSAPIADRATDRIVCRKPAQIEMFATGGSSDGR